MPEDALQDSAARAPEGAAPAAQSPEARAAAETAGTPVDITDGGPEMVQFLTAEGERVETELNAPYAHYLQGVDDEFLKALYRDMVLVRRVDAEGFALQRQGELGLWPSLLGQEAAQVGLGRALKPQDYVFPGYREHGLAWTKGVPPENLLGMFRGVNHGGWDSKENNFHLYTIVIGNQMLHATGYARGVQLDGAWATGDDTVDTAVVACTGDGGTSQGDYNEAMVFAAVAKSPCVFFVQNNQWAISEPTHRNFVIEPFKRAAGFGFPGVRVDGNDVLASMAVGAWALDHARSGKGPVLVEAFTYRMGAHTTSDDPTKYRDDAHVQAWKAKDPIDRLKKHMVARGVGDDEYFAAVDAEADELAARVRKACQTMPDPELATMFDHTYSGEHAPLTDEGRAFVEYHAGFEGN
ncbi:MULTISPECIES: pyruvate dehydrogenase (acetyl-transferring) E1 component subunit alpha [Kytococcus]|uniref:pyruvate dehydrogenase (acetyl-transferring) E1 component subunit alpha n=1 Tax=Kytococcus TaxID=57499 RepID=UPI003529F632